MTHFESVVGVAGLWSDEMQNDFIQCDLRAADETLIAALHFRQVPQAGEHIRITGMIGTNIKTKWNTNLFRVDSVEHVIRYDGEGYAMHHAVLMGSAVMRND